MVTNPRYTVSNKGYLTSRTRSLSGQPWPRLRLGTCGQEEGGAAKTTGRFEGGAIPASRRQGDRRPCPSSPRYELSANPSPVFSPSLIRLKRKFYKGKKYKPLDLRPKKTRAMRHWLTKHEEKLKTKKQQWKERLYPLCKYSAKA
ncbi:hypothetical protein ACRRTK_014790 [Alexandromys fortis]